MRQGVPQNQLSKPRCPPCSANSRRRITPAFSRTRRTSAAFPPLKPSKRTSMEPTNLERQEALRREARRLVALSPARVKTAPARHRVPRRTTR